MCVVCGVGGGGGGGGLETSLPPKQLKNATVLLENTPSPS